MTLNLATPEKYTPEQTEYAKHIHLPDTTLQLGFGTVDWHNAYDSILRCETPRAVLIFAHFLEKMYNGTKPIRILDVGGNPEMLCAYYEYQQRLKQKIHTGFNEDIMYGGHDNGGTFEREFSMTFAGLVSRIEGVAVCASDIYPPFEKSQWTRASFVQGDFLEKSTRDIIHDALGGDPNIITGEQVFINNVNAFQKDFGLLISGEPSTLGQRLAEAAYEFLEPEGWLFVSNGIRKSSHDELLPAFLRNLAMKYFYWDGLIKVYQKSGPLAKK